MKRSRFVTSCVLAGLLLAGLVGGVGAEASDRACVGTLASSFAKVYHPLGQTVSWEAQTYQPFGATQVAPFATSCPAP